MQFLSCDVKSLDSDFSHCLTFFLLIYYICDRK
nr:MAG TPA: hypothetical protein [Caudoviricetes sp.]